MIRKQYTADNPVYKFPRRINEARKEIIQTGVDYL